MTRRVAAVPALLVLMSVAVAGCFPAAATAEGRDIGSLYRVALTIAVGVVLLVWVLCAFAILRYRRRPDARPGEDEPRQTRGNVPLEVLWTAVPLLIVGGLFAGTLVVLGHTDAETPTPAVEVEVDAFRWGWTFGYARTDIHVTGFGAEVPTAVVPVGVPIRFRLQSEDVIHSFYVPLFLFKRDVIPGRVNTFDVTIQEPGLYGGQCAEYCGVGHSSMPFNVRAVSQAEFDAWIANGGPVGTPGPTP